jgi:hypothetical protein
MKANPLQLAICSLALGFVSGISIPSTFAQSQALNGQIEGTVSDQNNAAVSHAIITVTNLETGVIRSVSTDETGVYRFPLLPLGSYRVTAEAANFKKFVREGITLATGQIATIDLILAAGEVQEVVTVSADTSIADAGKTDSSRVLSNREVQNLPLVSRNPYNFAFLQANVTGRPARGGPFTTINANGYLRRVNFLLDGNTNTQGDRGTLRFMLLSEIYISEMQLVTNGFAAEFGNTPGMIMNVVTPSGTNKLSGTVSYLFRRPSFYSRPFFFPGTDLLDNKANTFSAAAGAPIIADRWHFYLGYEWQYRDDKAVSARLLTITAENQAQLIAAGLPAAIFPAAIPGSESASFYIFRTDVQLNDQNRLTARVNRSAGIGKNLIPAMLNTLERSLDTPNVDYALAVQLASYTPQALNEFRFQYAQRTGTGGAGKRNEFSGSGPSIAITGVANFGSPEGVDTIFLPRRITQLQDNLTRTIRAHVVKFGGGFNFYNHSERSAVFSRYTFPSISAYLAARNGTAPRSYTSYVETFGNPEINYRATFWNFFVQDDWKLTRRLKLSYGLRYDLYRIPPADPAAPFPASQRFRVDKNNFAPRLGVAYSLREGDRRTVLRAGAGIYYDQPLLAMYQRALLINGNLRFFSFSFAPSASGAPAFPHTLGSLPAGAVLPRQSIDTIAPEFENMFALHINFQIEQSITRDLSLAAGYVHSGGHHLPVYRNINPINPIRFLADGRPVFSTSVSAATRRDPRFNIIQMVESVGTASFNAFTLQLTQRLANGLQFSAHYTLAKGEDDAPEQNMTTGNIQGLVLSDPTNRALDKGNSFADQRHTFVMSLVAQPKFDIKSKPFLYLLNNNQVGIIATANSGETFNIISSADLNGDGIQTSDRPVGIKRNSGMTPRQFNVDLRYSRFLNFAERYRLEVFGEFVNLFNINSIVQFNNVTVPTNAATGALVGTLPDFRARGQSSSQDSRQFQLGLKFSF